MNMLLLMELLLLLLLLLLLPLAHQVVVWLCICSCEFLADCNGCHTNWQVSCSNSVEGQSAAVQHLLQSYVGCE
jgi:hypothetical protein